MYRPKFGVLVSGGGTNLQAILDAVSSGKLEADIGVVISNVAGAGALKRAEASGVPTATLPHKSFGSREQFDEALVARLLEADVQWIVLADFMRLLTPTFLEAFPWRVINIHPALLPAFPGVDAQGQAFRYGAKITGCTVHLVDAGTDTGPILAQLAVPVLDGDTEDELRKRVLLAEHELFVDTLCLIAKRSVVVSGGVEGQRTVVRFGPP